MSKTTIVVVDDHPLFRQGVVDALSLEHDFFVIGQADDGNNALALILEKQPDVAVLDVNIPGINGLQLTRKIVQEKLRTKVVLVTAYNDHEQIVHAMRVGAAAYCAKDVRPDILVQVIRQAKAGKYFIEDRFFEPEEFTDWLNYQLDGSARSYSDPGEPFYPLSEREMEVLIYVTKGLSNKEIASILKISHQTVKNHVTSILRKLGVEDRTQAAVFALKRGWVRLDDKNYENEE